MSRLILKSKHRLKCGDSTNDEDVADLMQGEKADMVFTDPPYGVSFVGIKGTMYSGGKKVGRNSSIEIKNDDIRGEEITDLFFSSLNLACQNTTNTAPFYVFFAINRLTETIPALEKLKFKIRNYLIWDKGNVGYHAMGAQYKPNYECFLYCIRESPKWLGGDKRQTIWRYDHERLGLHPTMKPVNLIVQAIDSHESSLLYEPFCGSGSTLIACEKTGRKCYGMELDEHYCSVIIKRFEEFTGEKAVLCQS